MRSGSSDTHQKDLSQLSGISVVRGAWCVVRGAWCVRCLHFWVAANKFSHIYTMTLKLYRIATLALLVGIVACSIRTTDLTDSRIWPENSSGEISKILVVGVSDNHSVRNLYEREMQQRLQKHGVVVMRSLDKMPKDAVIEREAFETYFKSEGIDAVLVSQVVDVENVGVYSEGYEYAQPPVALNSYYDYYTNAYYNVSEPGHFDYAKILKVESNLFDVSSEQLVWQCHSKSFNKENAEKVVGDLTKLLTKAMVEDGVLE